MANNEISINPLNLKLFGFDKHDHSLCAEASTLGIRPGVKPYKRLYNDSMDIGIAIRSHVTDKVERFHLVDEAIDNDGDVMYWSFQPIDKKLLNKVSKVIIFND